MTVALAPVASSICNLVPAFIAENLSLNFSSCVESSEASLDAIVRVAPVSILLTVCSCLFLRFNSCVTESVEIPVSPIQMVDVSRYRSLNFSEGEPRSYVASELGRKCVSITTLPDPLLERLVIEEPPPPPPCRSSPACQRAFASFHFRTCPLLTPLTSISVRLEIES